MRDHQALIHDYFGRPDSQPLRPKELAGELKVGKGEFNRFKAALEGLIAEGKLIVGKNKTVRPATISGLIQGTIKRTGKGNGFFRPNDTSALQPDESLYISPEDLKDAFTGDEVLVQLLRRRERGQRCGRVIEIISRGSQAFVGTYFERRQQGFVRIDGSQFEGPISVGDPGAKGVLPDDRVVVEMLRFPSQTDAGEAVITKVLGPRGAPGVDLLSIIHEFQLPDEFSENVLAEARLQAQGFEEAVTSDEMKVTSEDIPVENTLESGSSLSSRHSSLNPPPRVDLTRETIITIDPIDARDFDDAISLDREPDGNWRLGVHIADVAHFVRPGTLLDKEAHFRGTSVYLPDKVLPMLPEVISNALASLQAGRVRYTKSVFITFSPEGTPLHSDFVNSKINVTWRFAYEQVLPLIQPVPFDTAPLSHDAPPSCLPHKQKNRSDAAMPACDEAPSPCLPLNQKQHSDEPPPPEKVITLLKNMHELAMILRQRRFAKGALDLNLPEVKIDMDRDGTVTGAHQVSHDESHQIIEEFMLAANMAVAIKLTDSGIPFLRRVHDAPDERKMRVLGEFAKSLGYKTRSVPGREDLKKLLKEVQGTQHEYAISFAILRSLKQAEYNPAEDIGHYALGEVNYCHFTSPIRRYPDLTIHRLLDKIMSEPPTKVTRQRLSNSRSDSRPNSPPDELVRLGKWCSVTERRAQDAERELIKLKMLGYLANRIGEEMDATITGVEKFGLFCTGVILPAEGLVHIRTMNDDIYDYDERSHTLSGRRKNVTYRLGDRVKVQVTKVNLPERKLELNLVEGQKKSSSSEGQLHSKRTGKKESKSERSNRKSNSGRKRSR